MDISMPGENGIQTTVEITGRYPDIAVMGLSVKAGEENRLPMRKAGATRLLSKELAVDQLYGAIHEALKGRAS